MYKLNTCVDSFNDMELTDFKITNGILTNNTTLCT